MLLCLPIGAIWFFAEQILSYFGQDESIAYLSGRFCRWSIIGLPALFLYEAQKKYLQGQSIVKPILYISIVANIVNFLLNYLFIRVLNFGFMGAIIARNSCFWFMPIAVTLYMWFTKIHKDTWDGWSSSCFSEWKQFFKLAIPSMIMFCSEWWAYEILNFMAGILSDADGTELAVNSVRCRINSSLIAVIYIYI